MALFTRGVMLMGKMCRVYAKGLCEGLKCSERCPGRKGKIKNPLPEMNTHMLSGELDRKPYA